MADSPVLSDLGPDATAFLARNLMDNALPHGAQDIENEGQAIPPWVLTARFVCLAPQTGSDLALASVAAIAGRTGSGLQILSPHPYHGDGFSVRFQLPAGAA